MNRPAKLTALAAVIAVMLAPTAAGGGGSASERRTAPPNWHDLKCRRYKDAWRQALRRTGAQGLGREFLERHQAFLASNCTRNADVCPRSREELRLANAMVVLSMDFGAASTFAPFSCGERAPER